MSKKAQAPAATAASSAALALHDQRAFFEKALAYGVQHGILVAAALDTIQADVLTGMVLISRYFGSEFSCPEQGIPG